MATNGTEWHCHHVWQYNENYIFIHRNAQMLRPCFSIHTLQIQMHSVTLHVLEYGRKYLGTKFAMRSKLIYKSRTVLF
jgi:hypothetical protein